MSTRLIRIGSETSAFEQVVPLDGENYTFVFRWNERASRWFLTLRDVDGNDLATGRKLVANVPWGVHETVEGFPPGTIWILDLGITGADPGLQELGKRVVLMYVDEANVL